MVNLKKEYWFIYNKEIKPRQDNIVSMLDVCKNRICSCDNIYELADTYSSTLKCLEELFVFEVNKLQIQAKYKDN